MAFTKRGQQDDRQGGSVKSKNKPSMTVAEREHVDKLAQLDCIICGAAGVEVHEPEQGLWFISMPLCPTCHRHPVYGWHGERRNWKARKMDELDAINATIRRLMS